MMAAPVDAFGRVGTAPTANAILKALIPEALRAAGTGPRRLIAELTIPVSRERADLAVIGEEIWLYEIKSAHDSLRRLPRQRDAFERIGQRCVLVVATRHLAGAAGQLPEGWGVVEATDDGNLKWRRAPQRSTALDRQTLLRLLWRDEAERALQALDGRPRTGRRRLSLLGELWRSLDANSVEACVRDALLQRAAHPERVAAHALIT